MEQVLLAQAARDAEKYPNNEAATYGGAALGGLVGVGAGDLLHMDGRLGEQIADVVNPIYKEVDGKKVKQKRGSHALKPGPRMAGGIIGAILGGALGPSIRNEMIQTSPSAALLAKAQTGTMTQSDVIALQQEMAKTYSQIGIV